MSDNQSFQDHPAQRPETQEKRASAVPVELTFLQKSSGSLSKVIRLVDDKVWSNGSACKMAHGTAKLIAFGTVHEFGAMRGTRTRPDLRRLRRDRKPSTGVACR
jgi:hypothetical protein